MPLPTNEAIIANLQKNRPRPAPESPLTGGVKSPIPFDALRMPLEKPFTEYPAANPADIPKQVKEGIERVALFDTEGKFIPKEVAQYFKPDARFAVANTTPQTTTQKTSDILKVPDYVSGAIAQLPVRAVAKAIGAKQPKAETFSEQAYALAEGVGMGKASPALGFLIGMIGDPLNLITGGGAGATKLARLLAKTDDVAGVARLYRGAGFDEDIVKMRSAMLAAEKNPSAILKTIEADVKLQGTTRVTAKLDENAKPTMEKLGLTERPPVTVAPEVVANAKMIELKEQLSNLKKAGLSESPVYREIQYQLSRLAAKEKAAVPKAGAGVAKEIAPELQPLAKEAQKYKSAEEFANNGFVQQGISPNILKAAEKAKLNNNDVPVGTLGDILHDPKLRGEFADILEMPVVITNKIKGMGGFADKSLGGPAIGIHPSTVLGDSVLHGGGTQLRATLVEEMIHARQEILGRGYDESLPYAKRPQEITAKKGSRALDTKMLNRSQLTDFYNKVKGEVGPIEIKTKAEVPAAVEKAVKKTGTRDVAQLERMLERTQKSLAEAEAKPEAHAKAYGGDKVPEYKAKIADLNERLTAARAEKGALGKTEEDSMEELATQHIGGEFVLQKSMREEEKIVSNLEMLFAEMKGMELEDIGRFTAEDMDRARLHYEIITDALIDHPGRFFTQFRRPGQGWNTFNLAEELAIGLRTGGKGKNIDKYISEQGYADLDEAEEGVMSYLSLRKDAAEAFATMREIARDIRLAKQKDAFVGAEKARLSNAAARNLAGLKAIAEAAERSGYRKGFTEGNKRFKEMVARLKSRRTQINAVKRAFNLTDSQMKRIRGSADPRFMDAQEFDTYLDEIRKKAKLEHARDQEKLLIEDMINTKQLEKAENLQRALEFPPVKDMSLEQLIEYGGILSKTRMYDTFLGPRMIQTAKNTDLGNIRTIGEGRDAIAKQTGMPFTEPIEGRKADRWLRDPTLVERDPLHKSFITEWAAKEADMLTRKYALNAEVTKLAKAARTSRQAKGGKQTIREKVFSYLTPKDELIVKWLQPFETTYVEGKGGQLKKVVTVHPELRARAEAQMTSEELKYAQFLEKFFSHYYNIAAQEATARWTLQGVKHSNYRSSRINSVYLPHASRSFFERWRDDGFVKAFKMLWQKNIADSRVDFNAFGDRGEVLGYEKWLKNNMERTGEGIDKATGQVLYSQNTAKLALAYFHGFERKLIIDAMTPKIKLLEFLMGKRFETPKSITNPEGTEKVHSQLTRHINEWINNKKGQRVEMVYEQGDRAEAIVDAGRLFIAVQQLGVNIIAQVIQVGGGEVATFAGAGIKGWATGHARAVTKQGRKIGRLYSGIIGDTPWNELASAANDAGDTLRGWIFYLFGDVAFRGRRQMLLGLMSKEEFATGKLTAERAAAIKLQMGKWLQMPEFRSIAGSTSFVKAAGMYSEWATPIIQNTYFVLIPKLRNMIRSTEPEKWKEVAKSEEFLALFRAVVGGAALGGTAYLTLNPDENDHSTLGYLRRRAAQEISSTISAISVSGVPTPFSIMNGYVDGLRNALGLLWSLERYQTAGAGHKAGELKAPAAFGRALIPRGIQQWMPTPETPLPTKEDIRQEILLDIRAGNISMDAAKIELQNKLKKLAKSEKERRFEMPKDEYRKDLRARLLAKEITAEDAKKEIPEYLAWQKKRDPEQFESDSDATFIDKVRVYAEAIGTDPVTAFNRIFTGQAIRRTDSGAIIVKRMSYEESQKVRKERGATADLILDHTLPLQLGGSNAEDNLKLVPKADWERYTPIENFLGVSLRNGDIDDDRARELITAFKNGEIDERGIYDAVESASRR